MTKAAMAASASDASGKSGGDAPSRVPASGRWWKPKQGERFSMVKIKPQKKTMSTSWKKKMDKRKRKQQMKEYERSLIEARQQRIEDQREARLERQKRKAANEFKSASVQVIKNPNKLKKMSKKQLRMIKKTKVDKDGNTVLVPAYSN